MLVLGGGISGITTAVVLQSLGMQVGILACEFPFQLQQEFITPEMEICWRCWRSSQVATTYAMASAYPHHLAIKNLHRISDDSQALFGFLFENRVQGIHLYRMYEVFEHCPESAPLGSRRMNLQSFEGRPQNLQASINPPHRTGAAHIWGWTFETYFADMPEYVPFLWSLFKARGGTWQMSTQNLERVLEIAAGRPVINCLGLSAAKIFDDAAPAVIVRGRQVIVPNAPLVKDFAGLPVAYNYTPAADCFSRADGRPEYVHFFPRQDGWVLGQTREPGQLDARGRWQGDAVCSPELNINGQAIPSPILDLNQDLLKLWMNHDLKGRHLIGREGYRYYRDPEGQGVRLEHEDIDGTLFVHNYGHGGSGITMSWGCALQTARILLSLTGAKPKLSQTGISQHLDQLVMSLVEQVPTEAAANWHQENKMAKKPEANFTARRGFPDKRIANPGRAALRREVATDSNQAELSIRQLVDDIVAVHHAFLNRQLPILSDLINQVAEEHGKTNPELHQVKTIFHVLKSELEEHALKEEQVLFPACIELEEHTQEPTFHCGSIDNPILVLESEHHDAINALAQMRQLTNNYQLPEVACSAYIKLLQGLSQLESDLLLHIHKEDKILFPKVTNLASSLQKS